MNYIKTTNVIIIIHRKLKLKVLCILRIKQYINHPKRFFPRLYHVSPDKYSR